MKLKAVHIPTHIITEVFHLATNVGSLKCLPLWLVKHQLFLLQMFTACRVAKATLIHFINGKVEQVSMDGYHIVLSMPSGWGHTHARRHAHNTPKIFTLIEIRDLARMIDYVANKYLAIRDLVQTLYNSLTTSTNSVVLCGMLLMDQ